MDNMGFFRMAVADKLCEIEDLCKEWNLPKLARLTLVARDPDNPEMIVVLTNEPGRNALQAAFDVALTHVQSVP